MTFVSVTGYLPSRDNLNSTEILYYVTRIANLVVAEHPNDIASKLTSHVNSRFGEDLELNFLDLDGNECDPQVEHHVVIKLTEKSRTTH
jgi:hypothetical protein